MGTFIGNWLVCFALVFPTWLVGAIENLANGRDLLWTAGFAAFLALVIGLARRDSRAIGELPTGQGRPRPSTPPPSSDELPQARPEFGDGDLRAPAD